MPLLLVGTNHTIAPLEVRERMALSQEQGEQMLDRLLTYVPNAVVLATCNRTEIYMTAQNPTLGAQHVHRFLAEWTGLPVGSLTRYLYSLQQWGPLEHLLRVASGLDSMILGEEQILGQVRAAVEMSRQKDALDAVLAAAFTQALRTGRRVRSETRISRNAVSVSSAAVDLAERTLGTLAGRRALVVAAGEAGKLAARSLQGHGVTDLVVVSRTLANAQVLARSLHAQAVPLEALETEIAAADLVVTTTGAQGIVHTRASVERAMAGRDGRPLVIIDIAVPRDVEAEVGNIPGVMLYNIEDVQHSAEHNLALRRQEVAPAEAIVASDVAAFQRWWQTQEVLPTIRQLQRKAETIRKQELDRTLHRLDLSDADRATVEAMSRALIKKLLHDPLVYLKTRRSGEDALDVVQALFGLAEEAPTPPVPATGKAL